ncbi:MAG TPA: ribosomal protein S18-alanine N-acetyltransferase [Solirubrobacteraceae bacterium]|nr:ribosomal protein S18-alanine N-acetyltransferase [Solirubrobacteraceae bacterium]
MNGDGFSIRPLSYADLPQVIAIERRTFTTPWSLAMFVLELSKSAGLCLAATDSGGQLLGYLICSRFDTAWHLMNVAVDPSQRRRGIGSALLEEMIERAGPDEEYTLEVRPSNAHAITLYERLGFRAAGRRPRYYRDNGEDALIMWRTLQTTSESTASG